MGASSSRPKQAADGRSISAERDRQPVPSPQDDVSDAAPVAPQASTVSEDTLDSSVNDAPNGPTAIPDAKKTVQVIRVDPVETFEDDTNQTGLSEYEMRKVDQFYHTPYRMRGRAYNEAAEIDRKKAEEKRAKKEEKKAKRRSKGKKGVQEPEEIVKHTVPWAIQNAKRLGVLNLQKMDLEAFPDEIFDQMPGTARIINISMNRMTALDPRMYDYVLVQRLIANNNLISSIHPGIQRMTALKKLDLARNNLSTLPDTFAALRQLELVDLSHNKLESLPPSFAELDLTDLNLMGNLFTVAPPEIEPMEGLLDLNLSNNKLSEVPQTWMSLSRLISLRLDNNNISDFPAVVLQLCPDLTTLRLRGNPIKMSVLEAMSTYQLWDDRRRMHLKRQVDAGTISLDEMAPADR